MALIPSAAKCSRRRGPACLVLLLAVGFAGLLSGRAHLTVDAFGTGPYHAAINEPQFTNSSIPPQADVIDRFGRVSWYAMGWTHCPGDASQSGTGGIDGDGAEIPPTTSISPDTLPTSAGPWTFLIRTDYPQPVSNVALRINGEVLEPRSHEPTTSGSSLWDFDCPSISSNATADLVILSDSDTLAARPLIVSDRDVARGRAIAPGRITLRLVPHVFDWAPRNPADPTAKVRALVEVPCTDEDLSERLLDLGVQAIAKAYPLVADGDSIQVTLAGKVRIIPQHYRSRYVVTFTETHSVPAMIAILHQSPSVLYATYDLLISDGVEE